MEQKKKNYQKMEMKVVKLRGKLRLLDPSPGNGSSPGDPEGEDGGGG